MKIPLQTISTLFGAIFASHTAVPSDEKVDLLWMVNNVSGIVLNQQDAKIFLPFGTVLSGNSLERNGDKVIATMEYPFRGWIDIKSVSNQMVLLSLPPSSLRSGIVETRMKLKGKCQKDFLRPQTAFNHPRGYRSDFLPVSTSLEGVKSPEQCCEECLKHSRCSHWSQDRSDNSCVLYFFEDQLPQSHSSSPSITSGSIPSDVPRAREKEREKEESCDRGSLISLPLPLPADLSLPSQISIFSLLDRGNVLSPSSLQLRTSPVTGNWDEQWLVGSGRIGAMVGGPVHYEIVPFSIHDFYTIPSSRREIPSGLARETYRARAAYLKGDFKAADSLLSSANGFHDLGTFGFLLDLVFLPSPLPLKLRPNPLIPAAKAKQGRRERVESLLQQVQQPSSSFVSFDHILHQDSQLDLSSGIAHSLFLLSRGSGDHSQDFDYHRREWLASSVDQALLGLFQCQSLQSSQGCLNIALELVRFEKNRKRLSQIFQHWSLSAFQQLQSLDLAADLQSLLASSVVVHFSLQSSKGQIAPATHVWLLLVCEGGDRPSVSQREQSVLFLCNRAKALRVLVSAEKVDNLGKSLEELQELNEKEGGLVLEERSRKAFARLLAKGFEKIRADHVQDLREQMEGVSLDYDYDYDDHSLSNTTYRRLCQHPVGNLLQFKQFGRSSPMSSDKSLQDLTLMAQLYQYGRYLALSSSRGSVSNLQGLWADTNSAVWSGDYHLNINLQMNYWAIFPSQISEAFDPLLEYLLRMMRQGGVAAQKMYGILDNSTSSSGSNKKVTPWVSHGFTDSTLQSLPYGALQWSMCSSCGAWLASHLHDLFLYSNPLQLSAERLEKLLSVYRGMLVFFLQYSFRSKRGYHTGPTTSPENSHAYFIRSSSDGSVKTSGTKYLTLTPAIDISILRQVSNQFSLMVQLLSRQHPNASDLISAEDHALAASFEDRVSRLVNQAIPVVNEHDPSLHSLPLIQEYPDSLLESAQLQSCEDIDYGHRHLSSLHWLFPNHFLPFLLPSAGSEAVSQQRRKKKNLYLAALRTVFRKYQGKGGHTEWSSLWMVSLLSRLSNYDRFLLETKQSSSSSEAQSQFALVADLVEELFAKFFRSYLSNNYLSLHPKLSPQRQTGSASLFAALNARPPSQDKRQLARNQHQRLKRTNSTARAEPRPQSGPLPAKTVSCSTCFQEILTPLHRYQTSVQTLQQILRSQSRGLELHELQQGLTKKPPSVSALPEETSAFRSLLNLLPRDRDLVDAYDSKLDGNLGYLSAINELLVQSFLPNTIHLFPVPSLFLVSPQAPFPIQGQLEGLGLMGNSRILRLQWRTRPDPSSSSSSSSSSSWRAKVEVLVLELDLSHFWWRAGGGAIQEKTAAGKFGFFALNEVSVSKAELRLIAPHALTVVQEEEQQKQQILALGSRRLKTSSFCAVDRLQSLPPKISGPVELLPDYLSMVSQGKHQLVLSFDLSQLRAQGRKTCLLAFR